MQLKWRRHYQEFQHHALSILLRELRAEGFARFLRLYRSGRGDKVLTAAGERCGPVVEDWWVTKCPIITGAVPREEWEEQL